ncbi:MAG: fasciclin domain-containing protein [Mucilaginibacter sp.]
MKNLVISAFLLLTINASNAQIVAAITPTTAAIDNNDNTIRPNTTKSAPPSGVKNKKPAVISTTDITSNMMRMPMLSNFFKAVQAANLTETLKSKGPITIFVPNDTAFDKLPPGIMDTLSKPSHLPDLIALVTNHAIPGKLTAKTIARQIKTHKNNIVFTTLAGSKLIAKLDDNGNIVLMDETGGRCTVTETNHEQSNGELFIINTVLIPKNKL